MLNRLTADTEKRSAPGFSLIELMVSMVLTVIILGAVAKSTEIFRQTVIHTGERGKKSVSDGLSLLLINDQIASSGIAGRPDSFFIPCPGGTCDGNGLAVRNSEMSGIILSGAGGSQVEIFFSDDPSNSNAIERIAIYTIDGEYRAYYSSYEQILCQNSRCTVTFSTEVPADAAIVEVNTRHLFLKCEAEELRIYRTEVTGNPFVFDFFTWSPDEFLILRKGLSSCSATYVMLDTSGNIANNSATQYTESSNIKAAKIDISSKKSEKGTSVDNQSLFFIRNLE